MWRSADLALSLALALYAATPAAHAAPFEDTPDAAARDPDYAAAKAAMDKKNWPEAAKRFHQPALRDRDSADLHNYLRFSYGNLQQLALAVTHYTRAIRLKPCPP